MLSKNSELNKTGNLLKKIKNNKRLFTSTNPSAFCSGIICNELALYLLKNMKSEASALVYQVPTHCDIYSQLDMKEHVAIMTSITGDACKKYEATSTVRACLCGGN